MANEFKIKKGLIVTGASGGTVVDIQGSQGQLFSVTDDLSGSIFAVSDISGVPIFDVNSSGLSTFDGNVNLPDSKKILLGTGNDFQLYHDGTHGVLNNTTGNLYTSALGALMFRTSLNVTALTLDSSQNATFAGNITMANAKILYTDDIRASTGPMAVGPTGEAALTLRTFSTTRLTIASDGDATFTEQAFSAATSSGDASSTLTTKGYVDSLITGATIYRGTWDPDVSLNSGYGNPNLNTVTQTSGYYYICSADGAATPNGTGNEPDSWNTGDWVIWNDDVGASGEWQKIDNSSVLSGVGTGQTVALWQGASSVTDSETLGNAPITVSGADVTFTGTIIGEDQNSIQLILRRTSSGTDGNTSIKFEQPLGDGYLGVNASGSLAFGTAADLSTNKFTVTRAGDVGIGTASPDTELHIAHNSDAGASGWLTIEDTDITAGSQRPHIVFQGNGTEIGRIRVLDTSGMQFATGSSTSIAMTIDQSQRVGIGTILPSNPLHVFKNATIGPITSPTVANAGLRIQDNGASLYVDGNSLATDSAGYLTTINNNNFDIGTNSTSRIHITGSGNVGINTTSPSQKLHVVGNARVTGAYYDSNNSPGTANQVLVSTVTGTDWVDGSGSSIIGGPYLPLTAGSTKPLTGALYLEDSNTDVVMSGNTSGNFTIDNNTGNIAFNANGSSVQSMNITSSLISINEPTNFTNGNVGIGTTSPSAKLDVAGDLRIDGYSTTTNEAGLYLFNNIAYSMASLANCNNSYNAFRIRGRNSATNTLAIGSNNSSDYVLQVVNDAGTVSGNISLNPYGGNVGIGTASPQVRLTLRRENNGSLFEFNRPASGVEALYGGIVANDPYFYSNNGVFTLGINNPDGGLGGEVSYITMRNGATRYTTFEAGNVGIGTTSPDARFDVADRVEIDTYAAQATGNNAFLSGYLRIIAGAKTGWGVDDELGKIEFYGEDTSGVGARTAASIIAVCENGNGTSTTTFSSGLAFYTSPYNAAQEERMRITSGGNVGIGTTTPNAKLDIQGTQGQLFSVTDDLSGSIFAVSDISGVPIFDVNSSGVSYFDGNVGIGTDSPTAKLQVAGTTTYNSDSAQTLRVCDAADVSKGIHIGFDTTVNAGIIQAGDFGVSYRDLSLNPNAGNVGIGTTSPGYKLDVNGNARLTGGVVTSSSQTRDKISVWSSLNTYTIGMMSGYGYGGLGGNSTGTDYAMSFQMSNTANRGWWWGSTGQTNLRGAMSLTTTGKAVIATSLTVGYGEATRTAATTYALDVTGTIRATGDVIAYSDVRVKENIKTIDNSLEKVSKLRGVEFNKIGDSEKSIGVIAQEIEKVIPEVVKEDDKGMKSVAYGNISGLLIEAIKELKAEIEELKKCKCDCKR